MTQCGRPSLLPARSHGEDLFTYTIDDGRGGLAIGTVHVTVRGVNLPPVAVDDLVVTDEDVPVSFDPLLMIMTLTRRMTRMHL